jgi:hypothetical protein
MNLKNNIIHGYIYKCISNIYLDLQDKKQTTPEQRSEDSKNYSVFEFFFNFPLGFAMSLFFLDL